MRDCTVSPGVSSTEHRDLSFYGQASRRRNNLHDYWGFGRVLIIILNWSVGTVPLLITMGMWFRRMDKAVRQNQKGRRKGKLFGKHPYLVVFWGMLSRSYAAFTMLIVLLLSLR